MILADIPDNVLRGVLQHAESAYPMECCGLVTHRGGILKAVPGINVAPDPYRSFRLDPMFYVEHQADTLAVYHSHPDRSPEPSSADKVSCERCNKPYLIVNWPEGKVWSHTPDGYQAPLEGREFVYGVFDCWSVVKDYYSRVLGKELRECHRPEFNWWATEYDHISTYYADNGFVSVDSPEPGDVLVMQLNGALVPNHIGVYLSGGLILHHTLFKLSRIEVYGGYWRKHTVKVIRHAA